MSCRLQRSIMVSIFNLRLSFKVTYRSCLAGSHPAKHIKERAMHAFLHLSGTVADVHLCRDLLALDSALILLLRLLEELGIVRTGCSLVSGVVSCICQAVCRGRGHLTFPSRRISSLYIVHRVRAQTFDLAGRSTVEALAPL